MTAPTIGEFKAQGLTGVFVICGSCPRPDVPLTWEQVGLPDDTPFPKIDRRKQFVCAHCGGLGRATPDWRGFNRAERARRKNKP